MGASGETRHELETLCTSALDLNAWGMHELRPDPHAATVDTSLLVQGFSVHRVDGFSVRSGNRKKTVDYASVGTIGRWRPTEGTVETVLDTWDLFNPATVGLSTCNLTAACVSLPAFTQKDDHHPPHAQKHLHENIYSST